MDLTRKSALGTEKQIKGFEVATRFLKETKTLPFWKKFVEQRNIISKNKARNGNELWWKVNDIVPASFIFGNHSFGVYLHEKCCKFSPHNFTDCFKIFVYMNYDDDFIIDNKILDNGDFLRLSSIRKTIDNYIKNGIIPSVKFDEDYRHSLVSSSFEYLIKTEYIDSWAYYYKRKKFKNEYKIS